MIDLRSDTLTQPTPAMREAIARAAVGDEQKREDPTVNELERRGAEFLGQEEAVFLPTATMANQIALNILGNPGDALLVERHAHIMLSELGGPAAHSGLLTIGLPGTNGRFSPDQVVSELRDRTSVHVAPTRLVAVENTHNSSGGRVWPLAEIDAIVAVCREHDLRIHLDGARLANAATGSGVEAARIGRGFDTVTLCFSKGLGCPLGALIAGSAELMARARRGKHYFGGAMRQAGIVAAAALYALDHHVDRIGDDHARARRLAAGLAAAGLGVDLDQVETNFVQIDVGADRAGAIEQIKERGVLVSTTVHPTVVRAVIHLDISDEDVDAAVEAIPAALGATRTGALRAR
ncbi:MAG: aminotransferase class I/II-fold pyridoxal phosphate-dependent enzyme [Actinobacteria bacterium]|nr:MAG: aminotransferase class I/II-fold pyridoxal phosphate-dependent enzyme [Actinomycetota bacterium]